MLLKELIAANADIILTPVTPDELDELPIGAVLFGGSVIGSTRPMDECPVTTAGHCMVCHVNGDTVYLLTLTRGGYAKVVDVCVNDLNRKHTFLYHVNTVSRDDPRFGKRWDNWNV